MEEDLVSKLDKLFKKHGVMAKAEKEEVLNRIDQLQKKEVSRKIELDHLKEECEKYRMLAEAKEEFLTVMKVQQRVKGTELERLKQDLERSNKSKDENASILKMFTNKDTENKNRIALLSKKLQSAERDIEQKNLVISTLDKSLAKKLEDLAYRISRISNPKEILNMITTLSKQISLQNTVLIRNATEGQLKEVEAIFEEDQHSALDDMELQAQKETAQKNLGLERELRSVREELERGKRSYDSSKELIRKLEEEREDRDVKMSGMMSAALMKQHLEAKAKEIKDLKAANQKLSESESITKFKIEKGQTGSTVQAKQIQIEENKAETEAKLKELQEKICELEETIESLKSSPKGSGNVSREMKKQTKTELIKDSIWNHQTEKGDSSNSGRGAEVTKRTENSTVVLQLSGSSDVEEHMLEMVKNEDERKGWDYFLYRRVSQRSIPEDFREKYEEVLKRLLTNPFSEYDCLNSVTSLEKLGELFSELILNLPDEDFNFDQETGEQELAKNKDFLEDVLNESLDETSMIIDQSRINYNQGRENNLAMENNRLLEENKNLKEMVKSNTMVKKYQEEMQRQHVEIEELKSKIVMMNPPSTSLAAIDRDHFSLLKKNCLFDKKLRWFAADLYCFSLKPPSLRNPDMTFYCCMREGNLHHVIRFNKPSLQSQSTTEVTSKTWKVLKSSRSLVVDVYACSTFELMAVTDDEKQGDIMVTVQGQKDLPLRNRFKACLNADSAAKSYTCLANVLHVTKVGTSHFLYYISNDEKIIEAEIDSKLFITDKELKMGLKPGDKWQLLELHQSELVGFTLSGIVVKFHLEKRTVEKQDFKRPIGVITASSVTKEHIVCTSFDNSSPTAPVAYIFLLDWNLALLDTVEIKDTKYGFKLLKIIQKPVKGVQRDLILLVPNCEESIIRFYDLQAKAITFVFTLSDSWKDRRINGMLHVDGRTLIFGEKLRNFRNSNKHNTLAILQFN
jgi:uncharacterized protein YbjQ (UPF0145 family)